MDLIKWFSENWEINPDLTGKLLFSSVVLLILWMIHFLFLKIVLKNIGDEEYEGRYLWKKGIKNTYYVLVVIFLAFIWFDKIGSVATFLGLVSAGMAIALQDPLVNLAGWLFIIVRKPLKLGDRIQINDIAGDVIDVRFFQFTVNEINNWVEADQSTGRIIHIPNGYVFKYPQANFTQGFPHIWNEIGVLVTFESDWKSAKQILEEIVSIHAEQFSYSDRKKLLEASRQFMIFYRTLTPIVYVSVKDNGVMLTIRYLVQPRTRRSSEDKIWSEILDAFAKKSNIDFAYPTQRIYYNLQEGKKGTVNKPNFPGTSFSP
jgi:small-conductance mechanosensitive channel